VGDRNRAIAIHKVETVGDVQVVFIPGGDDDRSVVCTGEHHVRDGHGVGDHPHSNVDVGAVLVLEGKLLEGDGGAAGVLEEGVELGLLGALEVH
jgi:hypothetical protein